MTTPHSYFDQLCALAAIGEISFEENKRLEGHLAECRSCRLALKYYGQISTQTYVESALEQNLHDLKVTDEQHQVKQALLHQIRGTTVGVDPTGRPRPTFGESRSRLVSWTSIGIAAGILVVLSFGIIRYQAATNRSRELDLRTHNLEQQLQDLQLELNRKAGGVSQSTSKTPQPSGASASRELFATNEMLRKAQASAVQRHHDDEAQLAVLEERVKLLQSSLDVVKASSAASEQERAAWADKISSLSAELRNSREDLARTEARNDELTQEALNKVRFAERQQKLLATDHDIRDILGARSLHIIDVYDVGSKGELERPFGRVFYTEGKSLIFYAFDLDQQKGLKRGTSFHAWGQKIEGQDEPKNLGAFYVDDPAQNRWVLKVDDTKVLSKIDYVFVTDGAPRHGLASKAKPLLSAYLNDAANHP